MVLSCILRALFVHVALPGQEPGAEDLPQDFTFPKMQELGLNLVTVFLGWEMEQGQILSAGHLSRPSGNIYPCFLLGLECVTLAECTA